MTHKCFIAFVVAFVAACGPITDEHAVNRSLNDLKVYPGVEVATYASEPMFSNPTNISIDAKGRVWVCEAYNYRHALNPKNPVKEQGDRIMILEDTDGDGEADKSKVFYQGTDVNAALGICVLGNKVFVSCSPNVFVFTDENGDDVPDKKEIFFSGVRGEQHDHGIHSFTFGHDGRLYFNMGNEGRLLLNAAGDTIVDIHGRNVFTNGKPFRQGLALRCELDGSNVEVLGHNFRNNFELTVDPYGTIWQSDNDDDGNKGTRINYIMEQGNFGYTDEMTGAGWYARRTNMEKEIPFRHWHLNDPGVVPNVLQTGSGSPSGITLYEGKMLPEIFQGQIIHAEPGHNVVRSYTIANDGAGYRAEIVNLLEGQIDQWFRPIDVTSAPDGSLFVADWYDPGVGGHQVGDLDRGRIYRLSADKSSYDFPAMDLSSSAGAVAALLNPNTDVRFQGWMTLQTLGEKAEPELLKLWSSENPRHRAQALWLLARIDDKRLPYLLEALDDHDPNIRIAGIRAARQLEKDFIPLVAKCVNDTSVQVRREVALALRGNSSRGAATLWSQLALQHDGKDRWYLEALGIAAEGNWDLYFKTWKEATATNWDNAGGRDIVWRSRSKLAIPLLAELINEGDQNEMLRYFRAFDFHADASKQMILARLVAQSDDARLLYALKHMDASQFTMTPVIKAKLNNVLEQQKGKIEFVELTRAFNLRNKSNDLLSLALERPDSTAGKEAAKTLLQWDRSDLFRNILNADPEKSEAVVKALRPHIRDLKAMALMKAVFLDTTKAMSVRQLAIRSFQGPWEAEDDLLKLASEGHIPEDLHTTAAGVFQTAWRSNIREDGARYLKLPGSRGGKPLPTIAVLAEEDGDSGNGKKIFTGLCGNCHVVNNEGVNFGPDLSEIGAKLSREALYTSILYPDQGITFGYEAYQIKLDDGSTAIGRIISETEDAVEVQYINTQQTIRKSQILSRTKMETSLMPAGLQLSMSKQELIDLVEYLSGLKGSSLAIQDQR